MSANMAIVQAEWRARTLAEYRSASMASELLTWLLRLGFAPETLQAAHALLGDELDHADMTWEVYERFGLDDDPLEVPEGALALPQGFGDPTIDRLILACLDEYCLAATLASPLWTAITEVTREPGPKQVVERIHADSPRHAAFGWDLLDELLERDKKRCAALAKQHLPSMMARLERSWGIVPAGWIEPVGPYEQPWGLLPRARYKREFYQAIAEEVLPRLDSRNLSGRAAWGKRPKKT